MSATRRVGGTETQAAGEIQDGATGPGGTGWRVSGRITRAMQGSMSGGPTLAST
jgi:hypothetical protein